MSRPRFICSWVGSHAGMPAGRQQAKREVHALGALTVDSVAGAAGAAGAAAGAGVAAISMGVEHWVGKQRDQVDGLLPGRTSLKPQHSQQQDKEAEEQEGAWGEQERLEKGWGPGLAGGGVTNGAGGRGAPHSRGSGEEEEEEER